MPSYFIAGTPVPMPRPKAVKWGQGMMVVSNYGKAIKAWKETIEWEAVRWKVKPIDGPLKISLLFSLEPKPSLLKGDGSFRSNAREWPVGQRDGDCDNLAKAVLDALEGIVYVNDSMIVDLHVSKDWDNVAAGVTVYWKAVE